MLDRLVPIFVAGHGGLAGSAIVRRLNTNGFRRILTRSRRDLDLTDRGAVDRFFASERPVYVILAAGKVGGIWANDTYPADFIHDNLAIELNVIDAAWRANVAKFVFLGSSCIYPKHAPQPMREEHLLTGALEPTNEPYAIAKIAGIVMCQSYRRQHGFDAISLMPTNLYGPGDNFDPQTSHVLPALIRRFHEAKVSEATEVVMWGTGTPRREFMHADDLADATLFLLDRYSDAEIVNVGVGEDVSIRELGELIADVVGFRGRIVFDATKPDGTPRKLLDVSKLAALGWRARTPLRDGIAATYASWLAQPNARSTHT